MNKSLSVSLLFGLFAILFTGCAGQKSQVASNAVFQDQDIYYVERLPADERGVNNLIVDNLRQRGFQAKSGPQNEAPAEADYILAYEDNWMWDMTMYMLKLEIKIRNRTGSTIASGESYRPSLQRKPPEFMVDETLDEIFAKVNDRYVTPEEETDKKAVRAGGRSGLSGDPEHVM
ncbi:hypothetical protein [Cerasicoccus arenae]|uniref:Lipoprotein n=1 Tax=Cerasicoccus arenae TaxID=424488 RepID=A0A8J3GE34_9BACT|nr:hypothetical protein [Cerasicoccus arenae]MBK1858881.1 hypothetical protein [Cerasicoccus arenae]GHB96236.1 hypothetical protein GCM10007047_10010 [Cerasicoccus arenae]